MSSHVWCHGPSCHEKVTTDRVRGSKGSKVLRTNFSKETIEDLTKEVADVMCMIELMKEHLYIKQSDIVEGIQNKRDKLKIWSNLIERS